MQDRKERPLTPSRTIRLEPIGGIAGDMFIAACLDAWPGLWPEVEEAAAAIGLPEGLALRLEEVERQHFQARHFRLEGDAPTETGDYAAIRRRFETAPLGPEVRRHALGLLETLGRAEAAVHGIPLERVHFHELADWDSLVDLVGAAALIAALAPARWHVGALPLGGGRVSSQHGPLPVPAPATARLLEGFAMVDDGVVGERVTPTGAAILRHLEAHTAPPPRLGRLAATGSGAGTRTLPGLANILRLMAFEAETPSEPETAGWGRVEEQVVVAAFEVDDQPPEDLALAVDVLRRLDGVLDVTQFAGQGKKGRMAIQLQVLARPEAADSVVEACLAQTTTLGVRVREERRRVLPRRTVEAGEAGVGVKLAQRPGGVWTAKAEAGDLGGRGLDFAGRRRLARDAERAAEAEASDEGSET